MNWHIKVSLKPFYFTTLGDVQLLYFGNSPLRISTSAQIGGKMSWKDPHQSVCTKKAQKCWTVCTMKKSYKITEDRCCEAWSRSVANRSDLERELFILANIFFFYMCIFVRFLSKSSRLCVLRNGAFVESQYLLAKAPNFIRTNAWGELLKLYVDEIEVRRLLWSA